MEHSVEIDHNGFKGTVKLKFPTRSEKLAILSELQKLGYGKEGASEAELTDDKLKLADKIGEVVDQRLISIDVKHSESGVQIADKAWLDVYTEGSELVGHLGSILLGGISAAGKPQNSPSAGP